MELDSSSIAPGPTRLAASAPVPFAASRPATGEATVAEEDEEDLSFNVRDLLVWSAKDSREPAAPGVGGRPGRPAQANLSVDRVSLFYTISLTLLLACAELFIKRELEASGVPLITSLQKRFGPEWRPFFDAVGFPPAQWGVIPAFALAVSTRWRPTAARIILLQGVGKILKWTENLCFRQGRPFWVSSKVEMWHCPTAYGFPSGHALFLLLVVVPIVNDLLHFSHSAGPWTRALAMLASAVLLVLYALCMLGRLYLGTHFLHSLLMGAVTAVLLLQLFNDHNVAVIADRVMLRAQPEPGEPRWQSLVRLVFRCAGSTIVLAAFVGAVGWIAAKMRKGQDPHEWTERALAACHVAPATADQYGTAWDGIALIVGWLVAMSLFAVHARPTSSRKRYLRGASAVRRNVDPSYGTVFQEPAAKASRAVTSSTSLRHSLSSRCGMLAGIALQLGVTVPLVTVFPWLSIGHALAVVFALFVFPVVIRPRLCAQ